MLHAYRRPLRYIQAYRESAHILFDRVDETGREQDFVVYPLGFLWRQYVELSLKHLTVEAARLVGRDRRWPHGHDLAYLWYELQPLLAEAVPDESERDVANVARVIIQLAELDERSNAFRYQADAQGRETLKEVGTLNLRRFNDAMRNVAAYLDSAGDVIGETLQEMPEGGC